LGDAEVEGVEETGMRKKLDVDGEWGRGLLLMAWC
jgi:hypothetical protein